MTQYYDDGTCVIYHGDCRELLPALAAEAFVTDPPYGIGHTVKMVRNKGGGAHEVGRASVLYEDTPETTTALIAEVMPLLLASCDRGLVFPGTAMLYEYPRPASIGAVYLPAGTGISKWGFVGWQPILFYGACPYLAHGEGNRPNSFPGQGTADDVDHPCPKPQYWMRWAVNRVSRPSEIVLDPFMGSGTTLRAAKDLGRKAIGIEIEERYCEIAAKRLAQDVLFSASGIPDELHDEARVIAAELDLEAS